MLTPLYIDLIAFRYYLLTFPYEKGRFCSFALPSRLGLGSLGPDSEAETCVQGFGDNAAGLNCRRRWPAGQLQQKYLPVSGALGQEELFRAVLQNWNKRLGLCTLPLSSLCVWARGCKIRQLRLSPENGLQGSCQQSILLATGELDSLVLKWVGRRAEHHGIHHSPPLPRLDSLTSYSKSILLGIISLSFLVVSFVWRNLGKRWWVGWHPLPLQVLSKPHLRYSISLLYFQFRIPLPSASNSAGLNGLPGVVEGGNPWPSSLRGLSLRIQLYSGYVGYIACLPSKLGRQERRDALDQLGAKRILDWSPGSRHLFLSWWSAPIITSLFLPYPM